MERTWKEEFGREEKLESDEEARELFMPDTSDEEEAGEAQATEDQDREPMRLEKFQQFPNIGEQAKKQDPHQFGSLAYVLDRKRSGEERATKVLHRIPTGKEAAVCQRMLGRWVERNKGIKKLLSLQSNTVVRTYESHEETGGWLEQAWDDVTGTEVDYREVKRARLKEMKYIAENSVWTKMTKAEAIRRGIKMVKTRWIDINNGDEQTPVYRSRLVAKEFNTQEEEGLFAATPPLEALWPHH